MDLLKQQYEKSLNKCLTIPVLVGYILIEMYEGEGEIFTIQQNDPSPQNPEKGGGS